MFPNKKKKKKAPLQIKTDIQAYFCVSWLYYQAWILPIIYQQWFSKKPEQIREIWMAFSGDDFPIFWFHKRLFVYNSIIGMQDVSYLTRHYFFAIELLSKGWDSSLDISQREAHMNNGSTQSRWDFILRRNTERGGGDRIKDVSSGFRTASLHGASRETSNRTATCYNRNESWK